MALTVCPVDLDTLPEAKCHLLPCSINKDGDADVEKYFETSIRTENGKYRASFRGRPLNGQKVLIPAGYTGMVIREVGSAVTEEQDRFMRVDQFFTTLTAWNLDRPPTAEDKLNKALQFIRIAKAAHRPVNEESSQNSQSSQQSMTGK